MVKDTFVYVIRHGMGDYIKIGIAKSPIKRLAQLNGASPVPLQHCFAFGPFTRIVASQIEYRVHFVLCEFRAQGEWFTCPPELASCAIADAQRWVKHRHGNLGYRHDIRRKVNLGRA